MILSTKGRYGLKAAYQLALRANDENPMPLKDIAQETGVSQAYLELLLVPLKKQGLVVGTRGCEGGYSLAKPPKDITVGEVLRALEGPMLPSDCVVDGDCGSTPCVVRKVWTKLYDAMNEALNGMTLENMVNDTEAEK